MREIAGSGAQYSQLNADFSRHAGFVRVGPLADFVKFRPLVDT